jgi:hypothetical protein
MAGLMERMLGAAKLDAATYEEVENDATATPQAMLVVVLASVAGGLGAMRATGIVGLLLAALAFLKTQADVGLRSGRWYGSSPPIAIVAIRRWCSTRAGRAADA